MPIVGQDRSIVHELAGTTRDWIESASAIDGWPVLLRDTAGVRQSEDLIEKEGIARALEQVTSADLTVLVIDAQVGWTEAHQRLVDQFTNQTIACWNKADLNGLESTVLPLDSGIIETSCVSRAGLEKLLRTIGDELFGKLPPSGVGVPFRSSQRESLQKALTWLDMQDHEAARTELLLLTESAD